jgi:hypothetical protein
MGEDVKTELINPNIGHEIDAGMFNNGIYFITLIQDGKLVGKQKLVIMK